MPTPHTSSCHRCCHPPLSTALRLQLDAALRLYDAVLHVGDIAYNLEHDDGKVGDEFLRMVEPIAARVPYMTCPGNHEREG